MQNSIDVNSFPFWIFQKAARSGGAFRPRSAAIIPSMRRLLAILLLLATSASAAELNVSAAASLQDALREIAAAHESLTHEHVRINSGASSILAMQIRAGAPADVFLSADEAQMNALDREQLLVPHTRRDLLGNSLVVVVPRGSTLHLRDATDLAAASIRRIALAEPSTVPAGIYAKEWLTRRGVWSRIAARVVPVENVRAALAMVENGNADAAIVYRTDAGISKQSVVAFSVTGSDAPHVVYPVAIIAHTPHPREAQRFLAFLTSSTAKAIFRKYGFVVL
jgi:molybdate transport system substrate-binding protein